MKKVHVSEIEGPSRRGRPLGRWKDRLKKYMSERGDARGEGLNKQKRSVWIGRGRGSSVVTTHLGDVPEGSEASEL